jgi:hypothetical protein
MQSTAVLTTGRISSAIRLLHIADERDITLEVIRSSFARLEVVPADEAINLALGVRWLDIEDSGLASVTPRGRDVMELSNHVLRARAAIFDFASTQLPTWLYLCARGRADTLAALSPSTRQCFEDAALVSGLASDVVAWWDAIGNLARSEHDKNLLEIGRQAERLTIEYERARTGVDPVWQSIETNLAGYDVLSFTDMYAAERLAIEVKGTLRSLHSAEFHISRHEWIMASEFGNFVFHLWSLATAPPQLAVVSPADVGPHIPLNEGAGSWESVTVPFRSFEDSFAPVQADTPQGPQPKLSQ